MIPAAIVHANKHIAPTAHEGAGSGSPSSEARTDNPFAPTKIIPEPTDTRPATAPQLNAFLVVELDLVIHILPGRWGRPY